MDALVCWVASGKQEQGWAKAISLSSSLRDYPLEFRRLPLRTRRDFGLLPPQLLRVLEAESPDVILHDVSNDIVLLTAEVSNHNPMGANSFQRLARLATSARYGVPAILIAPSRKWVSRQMGKSGWEELSPAFHAVVTRLNQAFLAPVLYVDSSAPNVAMKLRQVLRVVDSIVTNWRQGQGVLALRDHPSIKSIVNRHEWSRSDDHPFVSSRHVSIVSTLQSTTEVLPEPLLRRPETVVLTFQSESLRADPYGGWVVAADWLLCRDLRRPEQRYRNLALCFPDADVAAAIAKLKGGRTKEFRLLYRGVDILSVGRKTWVTSRGDFQPSDRQVQARLWKSWSRID